jgi:hypothetical protein
VNQKWFLRKYEDGNTFGPVQFDQIARWAAAAQIAPRDTLSSDGQTWIKAPMVPKLSMDWLVELTSEHYYGPTTLGTLREFIRLGEIDGETVVINSCDGTRRQVREMPDLWQTAPAEADENQFQIQLGDPVGPAIMKMSTGLQERIRDLEQTLQEERCAHAESQQRYNELEQKYQDLLLRDLS